MPPNINNVLAQADIMRTQASILFNCVNDFQVSRTSAGDALTAGQRGTSQPKFLAAMTALEAAAAAIRTELATP